MAVKVQVKIGPLSGKFKALKEGGELQKFLVDQVAEGVNPYVPKDTSNLESSLTKGEQEITWSSPYAKELWYGKSKTGKDLKFKRTKNPKAGRMWAMRYKAEQLEKLKAIMVKKVKSIK